MTTYTTIRLDDRTRRDIEEIATSLSGILKTLNKMEKELAIFSSPLMKQETEETERRKDYE